MPNYNTQGITSSAGSDPRNLGGSEGYGNPTASTSSGLMSSTANATTNNDDNDDEPGFFESIANLFSGAGADLPSDKSDDDGDSGISFYDSPMFAPYTGGSDNDTAAPSGLPFETTAADRALYEALGVDVPEVYQGKMPEEEPEPNLDMDVLQKALQPEPITVEEIEVKAGDTLTAIAEEKGVPVQAVIDANPQIKNPDLIRPGEKVTLPSMISDMGKLLKTATDPEALAPVSEDPDREFYQSGVPIEERVFEGAETSEGLMSPRFDTKGDTGLTTFYEDIGKKAESDHGSTPVATKDARETKEYIDGKLNPNYIANEADRSKDVGYGHKVTAAEEASGKIRGVSFKNDDGTYKELTEEDKITILNADMQAHKEAALDAGWETKLANIGTSWNELDPSYQRALTSLAYNVGGKKAGEDWTAVLKAAKDKDVVDFARQLRRKDAGRYTAGMDNRVIKELKFAGLIDKRSDVSTVLPLANASSGVAN